MRRFTTVLRAAYEPSQFPKELLRRLDALVTTLRETYALVFTVCHKEEGDTDPKRTLEYASDAVCLVLKASPPLRYYRLETSVARSELLDVLARLVRELLPHYTLDDLLDLAVQEMAHRPGPLQLLAEVSSHGDELDDRIASVYERALGSPCPAVRAQAAWSVLENLACWPRFVPVLRATVDAETVEFARSEISTVLDILQTELQSKEEEQIRCSYWGLDRVKYDVTRRLGPPNEEQESLEQAFAFLRMPYGIYAWYSERSVNMDLESALTSLRHFENWQGEIELSFQTEVPYTHSDPFMSDHGIHPLGAYIISSQFLWHNHESDMAERHLLRSVHLAETLMTRGEAERTLVMPRASLKGRYPEGVFSAYHDPRLHAVSHFYLGELYERRGDAEQAVRHYARFAELEPDFSPRNSYSVHPHYYDIKRFYPGTVEAHRRLGNLYRDHLGDPGLARFYYDKALRLSPSHHTPYRDYARLLQQAEPRRALDLMRREIETLTSYPDPDPHPRARCLPFEPEEVVARFKQWRAHPMVQRDDVEVLTLSVLGFLKVLSAAPYRNAYSKCDALAQELGRG